jgi:isochorismate pyruvate lyase
MKTPTDCNSLAEVRDAIDHVDEHIIALVGLRADYVRAARRRWAVHEGLDADFIEKLYRDLITHFIEREREHWRAL